MLPMPMMGSMGAPGGGAVRSLGPELWDDATAVFLGESSRISPGVYRLLSTAGAVSQISTPLIGATGKLYQVSFVIDSIASGGVGGDFATAPVYTTAGDKTFTSTATTSALSLKRSGITDAQISQISFRQVL